MWQAAEVRRTGPALRIVIFFIWTPPPEFRGPRCPVAPTAPQSAAKAGQILTMMFLVNYTSASICRSAWRSPVPGTAAAPEPFAASASTAVEVADLARLLRELRRREARRRLGSPLTYRELAARTGFSHSAIGAYLTGTTLAPADRFDGLVRVL